MLLQTPAMRILLPQRQKPFVSSWTGNGNGGNPLTINLPERRPPKAWGVILVCSFGGSGAPGIPSGWTGSGGDNVSASLPGWRALYRLYDGTEAPTVSCTATSATSMSALALTVEGGNPNKLPITTGTTSGTSTAPDAVAPVPIAPYGNVLWLTYYFTREIAHAIIGRPMGFCENELRQSNNSTSAVVIGTRRAISSIDPGPWALDTSLGWRSAAMSIQD